MAPSLPDLIWTLIFQKLPIKSQLTVCKMSDRGAQLVRAANRHVTTLVIYCWSTPEEIEKAVNNLSLASTPSMQLALAAGGDQVVPFDDYPTTTVHPSKWAYLELCVGQSLDLETIESLVNTFSAVTDLKFFGNESASCKNLTALLQHTQWRHQLTSLMIHWPKHEELPNDLTVVSKMITAINNLSALQNLATIWCGEKQLPVELNILARLDCFLFNNLGSNYCAILPSIICYVAVNNNLKVILSEYKKVELQGFFTNILFDKLVRFSPNGFFIMGRYFFYLCERFSFLNSIRVNVYCLDNIVPYFNSLKQLPQLVHLSLTVTPFYHSQNTMTNTPRHPLEPMPSVRALDLTLYRITHSQINWLNLAQPLPRLQAIHILDYFCEDCNVGYANKDNNEVKKYTENTKPNLTTAIKCFLNDQLTVCNMSLRGAELVRKANRHVTTLVIDYWANRKVVKNAINDLSLSSKPSMQLALAAGGEQVVLFDDYPLTTAHPSQWAYLVLCVGQLLDPETIESIVNAFSAVTNLNFVGWNTVSCKNLTALLQHSQWRNQLTSLMICFPLSEGISDDSTIAGQIITAVNDLSKLQCLAIKWSNVDKLSVEMDKIAQLEWFYLENYYLSPYCPFLPSFICHAAKNKKLKIILSSHNLNNWDTDLNNSLSQQVNRFLSNRYLSLEENLQNLCAQFTSLTSISVHIYKMVEIVPVFTALTQLPRLIHLNLWINVNNVNASDVFFQKNPISGSLELLPSVQALNFNLNIRFHSQLKWMNLAQRLPSLQAIHVLSFFCKECNISYMNFNIEKKDSDICASYVAKAIKCFCATLVAAKRPLATRF
ncbi:hypothetical protein TYRP_022720 [Tyrophagus putrescentiae]|nr:hypothetical protein TYRP_022720 [Tyrophagus putrescentiae]